MERVGWFLLMVAISGGLIVVGVMVSPEYEEIGSGMMITAAIIGLLCACMAGRSKKNHEKNGEK